MYLKTEDHEGTRCLECKNDAEKAKRPGCLSEKCKFQESKEFNNGYCKLHQCDYRLQEAIKKGGDKCPNYKRCKGIMLKGSTDNICSKCKDINKAKVEKRKKAKSFLNSLDDENNDENDILLENNSLLNTIENKLVID